MIRFYITAFIILATFCGPGSGVGQVYLSDHQRGVSVWAPPNYEDIQHYQLGHWDGSAEKFGDGDNHARARQISNIYSSHGTKFIVNGVGSTYIKGASEANTYIRIYFSASWNNWFKINFDLKGDTIIKLYEDWNSETLWLTFTGKGKEVIKLKDNVGTYSLWVISTNTGDFDMCFAVPASEEVCEGPAVNALPFVLIPLLFSDEQ